MAPTENPTSADASALQNAPTSRYSAAKPHIQIRQYVAEDHRDTAKLVSDGLMLYAGEGTPHHEYWVLFVKNSLATDIADIPGHYLRRGSDFFVATATAPSGETITVGTIGVEKISDSVAELRRVSVRAEYRRYGIGRMLMAHATQWAKDNSYTKLILSCASMQLQARKFYESLGYAFTKNSVRYEGARSMQVSHYERDL